MVVPRYLPSIGGVEKHVSIVAEKLIQLEYDITVLTYSHERGLSSGEKINSVQVLRIPYGWARNPPLVFSWIISNRKYFKDYDIIHLYSKSNPVNNRNDRKIMIFRILIFLVLIALIYLLFLYHRKKQISLTTWKEYYRQKIIREITGYLKLLRISFSLSVICFMFLAITGFLPVLLWGSPITGIALIVLLNNGISSAARCS